MDGRQGAAGSRSAAGTITVVVARFAPSAPLDNPPPRPWRSACAIVLRMTAATLDDPILERFRAAVTEIYGDRLERVVLFGSRARGDAEPDSDYDVAVFLRDMPDRFAEMNRLAEVVTDILYSDGRFIHAMPWAAETYNDPRMPLMHEIRAEGLDL
jgi:predicted nucleotidyltransferase